MKILTHYTLRSLKKNRVRTLVTIIGIVLSVALFTAVAEGAYSGQHFLIDVVKTELGSYHGIYGGMNESQLNELRAEPEIDRVETLSALGWAKVSDDGRYPYLRLSSMSEGLTELLSVRLISGRLPENEHELLISDQAESSTGVRFTVGQTLTLQVGQRVTKDGLPLGENNPYSGEDEELIEDTIIENTQAIEMATIYRNIIDSTRELISAVMDNRLNNVMKYLTSITLVMAIPTVISGIYGMNLKWLPFAGTVHGFGIVCVITLIICIITMFILKKKKML